jgi:hypothetical protein
MMGLAPIERVAHALEDICAEVGVGTRQGRGQAVLSQLLFEGCDLLGVLIQAALAGHVDATSADAFMLRARQAMDNATVPKATPDSVDSSVARRGRGGCRPPSRPPWTEKTGEERRASLIVTWTICWSWLVKPSWARPSWRACTAACHAGQFEASDIVLMDQLLTELGRTTREMRHKLLRVRLAPIATLFRRFGRFLRDLARERGQAIELCIEGGDTAVDRAIISRLYEPLVHIVRNAVAHGIESADERTAWQAGQGADSAQRALREGRVQVCGRRRRSRLDLHAIAAKANGARHGHQRAGERDIQRLIFQAGLSTAASVSNLAGRGVGLDVVASVVQSLGGTIDVRGASGRGTMFVLDLPVTVSLAEGADFRRGQRDLRHSHGLRPRHHGESREEHAGHQPRAAGAPGAAISCAPWMPGVCSVVRAWPRPGRGLTPSSCRRETSAARCWWTGFRACKRSWSSRSTRAWRRAAWSLVRRCWRRDAWFPSLTASRWSAARMLPSCPNPQAKRRWRPATMSSDTSQSPMPRA